jgi:hypothetical protein
VQPCPGIPSSRYPLQVRTPYCPPSALFTSARSTILQEAEFRLGPFYPSLGVGAYLGTDFATCLAISLERQQNNLCALACHHRLFTLFTNTARRIFSHWWLRSCPLQRGLELTLGEIPCGELYTSEGALVPLQEVLSPPTFLGKEVRCFPSFSGVPSALVLHQGYPQRPIDIV